VRVATTDRGQPWAIHADHSQILPETHYVDAFLPPTLSTPRFRRGFVQSFECRPAVRGGDCSDWKANDEPKTYVQVADKANFGASLIVRSRPERPITVEGQFSDKDLISLVAFVRSRPNLPPLPDGGIRGPSGVSGREPIIDISQQPESVWVRMSQDDVGGETATVRRTSQGWKLVDVALGIR
jgi:hypothetical protein